jgi:pimeloyl-ACP methyl ester carboxylesterase
LFLPGDAHDRLFFSPRMTVKSSPLPETVVLVPGIWTPSLEQALLARRLRRCGYRPLRFSYRSVRRTIRHNAVRLVRRVQELKAERIHLVGHSLGGLVILQALEDNPGLIDGRIVLLGSPVRGSTVARRIDRHCWSRWLIGRSGDHGLLGDGPRWQCKQPLGVIAGSRSLGIGRLLGGLSGVNDGVVNLEETIIVDVQDSIVVHSTHIGLLFSRRVAEQVCAFLNQGRFDTGRFAG